MFQLATLSTIVLVLFSSECYARKIAKRRNEVRTVVTPQNTSSVAVLPGKDPRVLSILPVIKNCFHNGKEYQEAETWYVGHLQYKCGKFGVYDIIGCRTDKNRVMKIGETFVEHNVTNRCFRKDSAVFYTQTLSSSSLRQSSLNIANASTFTILKRTEGTGAINENIGLPALSSADLPEGWKIVDVNGRPIRLKSIQFVSSIEPIVESSRNVYSSSNSHNSHISSVRKSRSSKSVGTSSFVPFVLPNRKQLSNMPKERVVGVGTGSVSLDSRRPTLKAPGFQQGTLVGTRSNVKWQGKAISLSNKRIAVGPGTFTFGTLPTGTFVKKSN